MGVRKRVGVASLIGLIIAISVLVLLNDKGRLGCTTDPAPRKIDRVRIQPRAPSVPAQQVPLRGMSDEVIEQMYIAIQPDAQTIRCDVGGMLEDGVYELRPDGADHPVVRDGVFSAIVAAPDGRANIERHLHIVGTLRWSEGRCEVAPAQNVYVRGTLQYADGAPAADHDVRGCIHGSFGVTDQDGAWQVEALAGTTCSPMAFTETEAGDFGKSNVVNVQIGTEDVDGVMLTLPADEDLWDEPTLSKLAGSLVPGIASRLEMHKQRARTLHDALSRTQSPQARQALLALIANEEAWQAWIEVELRRFEEPEERADALRDMWMNLY